MANTVTERGSLKLCHEGYMYTRHKRLSNGNFRWRCVKRYASNCSGSIFTSEDGAPSQIGTAHNHASDSIEVDLAHHRQAIKIAAQTALAKPTAILSQALVRLPQGSRDRHPNIESTKRVLRGQRTRFLPNDPPTLTDLTIAGEWII